MKAFGFFVLCLIALFVVGRADAYYECGQIVQRVQVQQYYAPVEQIQYRLVQPQVVRETIQLERQVIERDPIIVERQERVLQYQVQPQLQLQVQRQHVQYQQNVRVQKVQVQDPYVQQVQVQKVRVQPMIVQKQQAYGGSQTIIQQQTQRRGIIGRVLGPKSSTTIITR